MYTPQSSLRDVCKRTCEVNRMGENSSFILKCYVKTVPVYDLGPVHMIPGQLIAPGQLTDPGVNFASVHGLTPITVHMSFSGKGTIVAVLELKVGNTY